MACQYIAENPETAAKICYEKGYIADPNHVFNGQLLDSQGYAAHFADAKDSFIHVADDMVNLDMINSSITGQALADRVFVNIGEID